MKTSKTMTFRSFAKLNPNRQRGIGAIQLIVVLAVGALVLLGGAGAVKYIGQQKATNDMEELSNIRGGLIGYASKHNSNFSAFTLDIGCRQQVFDANRCTGSGASTAVANSWGGSIQVTAVAVSGGTNNGARVQSTLVPDDACMNEITYQWDQFAKIEVNSTTVKTSINQAIDDTTINSACSTGSNSVYWTVKS